MKLEFHTGSHHGFGGGSRRKRNRRVRSNQYLSPKTLLLKAVWYRCPSATNTKDFSQKFRNSSKEMPPDASASTYNAILMARFFCAAT